MREPLAWGIVAHLVADWLCQNHWMATYKTDLRHPAAWAHSGIHFLAFLCVFQPFPAFLLFLSHLLIDTRVPLTWWGRVIQQTSDPANPATLHVIFWRDQVAHIALIALAVALGGAR